MAIIDPKDLSKKENYRFLTSSVTPRPVAFISSMSEKGVLNAAPFSYFNVISAQPPLLSVSIGRKNGQQKDTSRNILQVGEFVVHITDEDNVKQVNDTSMNLPSDQSEVEKVGLKPIVSSKVGVPSIKESRVRLECTLEKHLVFEEGESATDFIIGRIVSYYVDDQLYEDGTVNTKKLKPIARLGGKQYAPLGKIFELDRPE
ncbi:flavin reductase family protein [Salipaludibacillus sp. CUR1]|uniref:flavin reductase family protein n=1 Tax=Salipaludibacillus sp. CUR1 TaxID=2820003 RepID=UPI001E3D5BC6|nr:flavin reductase family protein [Salipaludibacillus sp. CUR1]MCE7791629.1 flavin reductase family protein [Salipaludibacillus sp. CUR1]